MDQPWQMTRAMICQRMGWTLDYYDGLDLHDVVDLQAVWDGMQKAEKERR